MHSSRMGTVRSNSRLLGGGVCPEEVGVCLGGCRASSNRDGQKNRKIGICAPKNRNLPLKIGKK